MSPSKSLPILSRAERRHSTMPAALPAGPWPLPLVVKNTVLDVEDTDARAWAEAHPSGARSCAARLCGCAAPEGAEGSRRAPPEATASFAGSFAGRSPTGSSQTASFAATLSPPPSPAPWPTQSTPGAEGPEVKLTGKPTQTPLSEPAGSSQTASFAGSSSTGSSQTASFAGSFATDGTPSPPPSPAPRPTQGTLARRDKTLWSEATEAGHNIVWMVDAAKLKTTDKVAVSPSFYIGTAEETGPFRMMLSPKKVSEGRGGQSFRKANGRGYIQLKCEAPEEAAKDTSVKFKMVVGGGEEPQEHKMTTHNFAESGICCLPTREAAFEDWDWTKAVDEATKTFLVRLEIH